MSRNSRSEQRKSELIKQQSLIEQKKLEIAKKNQAKELLQNFHQNNRRWVPSTSHCLINPLTLTSTKHINVVKNELWTSHNVKSCHFFSMTPKMEDFCCSGKKINDFFFFFSLSLTHNSLIFQIIDYSIEGKRNSSNSR